MNGASHVPLPSLNMRCGVNCTALGTPQSLESTICYSGQGIITNQPVQLPTPCPLSCAHYTPAIRTSCPSVTDSTLLSAMNAWQPSNPGASSCPSCHYARVLSVLRTCGITITGSDVQWDLINTFAFPVNCSMTCQSVWPQLYSDCIRSGSMIIPTPVLRFTALCTPTGPPPVVSSLSFSNITQTSMVVLSRMNKWYTKRLGDATN